MSPGAPPHPTAQLLTGPLSCRKVSERYEAVAATLSARLVALFTVSRTAYSQPRETQSEDRGASTHHDACTPDAGKGSKDAHQTCLVEARRKVCYNCECNGCGRVSTRSLTDANAAQLGRVTHRSQATKARRLAKIH